MAKRRVGSRLDDFLEEEGILEDARIEAIKEVVAWQLAQAMKEHALSKTKMASMLKTSRSQVDRLLNARSDVTLSSLQRAAALVGRKLRIELI